MNLDQHLYLVSLSAYLLGSIALLITLFARDRYSMQIGAAAAIIGCITQFADLVVRDVTTGIWPLTNLYGSLSLFSAMSVTIFLIFAFRYGLWFIGGPVLLLASGFLAYASTWNEGVMPAVPALQSYWIKIHVPLVVSSYAAFLVAAVLAALYLVKTYMERSYANVAVAGGPAVTATTDSTDSLSSEMRIERDTPNIALAAAQGDATALWLNTLPSLPKLDVLIYRIIAVGLPLLTVGIITGAWWAKEAWGAYWQWDPKETAALFSWIIYSVYLHLNTRRAWRGERCAWISLIGFASIIFCYLGVNIWISGLHSYRI
jgi:cytochrome c-type biogenesis protein CcsB